MNKVYFTSDLHLGHRNIIQYDNRPFKTIEDHDHFIITSWNNTVDHKDTIYFLGDFSLGFKNAGIHYDETILQNLNGHKFFIKGNHDHRDTVKLFEKYGTYLGELKKIKVFDQEIVLCHYAMLVWNKSHHGSWHLHGHSHHSLPIDNHSLRLDVGVNGWNYSPVPFEQVKEELSKRIFKPIDHHK